MNNCGVPFAPASTQPYAPCSNRLLAAAAFSRAAACCQWQQRPQPSQQARPRTTIPVRRFGAPVTVAAASTPPASAQPGDADSIISMPTTVAPLASHETLAALLIGCVAMAMAAVHRAAFSVLALSIQQELGLSLPQMGMLQSALLLGYLIGQVPAGVLADRFGGALLATVGLLLWSSTCLLFRPAASSLSPFAALLAARAVLGLAQSCIMPSVATIAARWFPAAVRGRCTSIVYSSYSVGTVLGLTLTPVLAEHVGWASSFTVLGLAGMAGAAACSLVLPRERRAREHLRARQAPAGVRSLDRESLAHLAVLCFTHSVVSFSFFVLQAWIPTFLASTGMSQLSSIGIVSALPWLATAVVAVLAGASADRLQSQHGWSALRVRHMMQSLAAGGTAVSLLPLALIGTRLGPTMAVAALTAAVAFQGFTYAGLHSYVPEVAPTSAGRVLSITNTCGTLAGIGGNMLTGVLAGAWGYSGIFALTVALQAASMWAWLAGAHGRELGVRERH